MTMFGMQLTVPTYYRNDSSYTDLPFVEYTILKSWYEKGIKTVSQIETKETNPPKKEKAKNTGYQLDDMAALERSLRLRKQKN